MALHIIRWVKGMIVETFRNMVLVERLRNMVSVVLISVVKS